MNLKSTLKTLVFTFASLLLSNISLAQEAGSIRRVSGTASVISASNQSREAKSGDTVNAGETVATTKDSQVLIQMKDKSTMIVRSDSKVKIAEFKFEGNKATDTMKTTVLSGTLRAVSGTIGKGQPDNVKYEVGTATIGIRGTDIELAIIPEGQKDRAGTYNYVHDGETSMTLDSGETAVVEKELSGFTPEKLLPGENKLQILRDRPAFLQSSGFDALIQQLTQPRIMVR